MYNLNMFILNKRYLTFLLALLLLFGFVGMPIYAAGNTSTQNTSWWDAIVSFFGFGSANTNNNYSGSSTQTDNRDKGQVLGGEDLINSDRLKDDEGGTFNAAQDTADRTISVTNGSNIACLPSLVRADEPVLIRYSCPVGQKLTESSFGVSDSEGVSLLKSTKDVEYIKCKDRAGDTESRFECKITQLNPLVTTFSLDPANPQEGDPLRVIAKTQDMKNCSISNTHRSFVKYGTEFDFTYTAKNHDTIQLTCTDKTGLLVRKSIKY